MASLLAPDVATAQLASSALLGHNSPLGRLYTRFFGRHFDETTLRNLAAALGRCGRIGWINICRPTDFIGGPIFQDDPPPGFAGIRQLDPETLAVVVGEPLPDPMLHFDYPATAGYDAALERLVAGWV